MSSRPTAIAIPKRDTPSSLESNQSAKPAKPKFLKVIGVPPPNSDGAVTQSEFNIPVGTNPDEFVIDILELGNEDPFTLESLEELIEMHAENNVDFVLARVATKDDSEKVYYSYYAAHHINKPLNNMVIVGDVHYYAVNAKTAAAKIAATKEDVSPLAYISDVITRNLFPEDRSEKIKNNIRNRSMVPGMQPLPCSPISNGSYGQEVQSAKSVNFSEKDIPYVSNFISKSYDDPVAMSPRKLTVERSKSHHESDITIIQPAKTMSIKLSAFSNNLDNLKNPDEWLAKKTPLFNKTPEELYFEAKYIGSDDDFLMKHEIRAYFRKHCLESTDAALFALHETKEPLPHPVLQRLELSNESPTFFSRHPNIMRAILLIYIVMCGMLLKFVGNNVLRSACSFSFDSCICDAVCVLHFAPSQCLKGMGWQ